MTRGNALETEAQIPLATASNIQTSVSEAMKMLRAPLLPKCSPCCSFPELLVFEAEYMYLSNSN